MEDETFIGRINQLDQACANVVFKENPELKEIYKEMQNNMKEFRENVFFRHLEMIESGAVSAS